MFKVNNYFEGKVTSFAFDSIEGPTTIGVMAKGEYEFATSSVEYMTVISGKMDVLLPGKSEWKTYIENETFVVEKDVKFQVKLEGDTAYKCLYK